VTASQHVRLLLWGVEGGWTVPGICRGIMGGRCTGVGAAELSVVSVVAGVLSGNGASSVVFSGFYKERDILLNAEWRQKFHPIDRKKYMYYLFGCHRENNLRVFFLALSCSHYAIFVYNKVDWVSG